MYYIIALKFYNISVNSSHPAIPCMNYSVSKMLEGPIFMESFLCILQLKILKTKFRPQSLKEILPFVWNFQMGFLENPRNLA